MGNIETNIETVASCIDRIREIAQKEKENNLAEFEREEKEQCYNFLFKKMDSAIDYLVHKQKYLPNYEDEDIRQELRLQLMDIILPRLNKRVIKTKDGKIKEYNTTVDTNKTEQEIKNFLSFSLSQKYMRLLRSIYAIKTRKENGQKYKETYYKEPLDSGYLGIENFFDDNEENAIFEIGDNGEEQNFVFQELQLNNIREKLGSQEREFLAKALDSESKIAFKRYAEQKGIANCTLMLIESIVKKEYGYTGKTRNNKRLSSKK